MDTPKEHPVQAGNNRTMEAVTQELQFDLLTLSAIKGREINSLMKMNDLEVTAGILAKYVTACPVEWGDPKSPDTYLDLPLRGDTGSMKSVVDAMAEAIKNAS